jgi:hypothetical protein
MSVVKSIFGLLRFNQKNWKAVVLCVLAATVFWFFNALNKDYTTHLSFPLEFQYDQDNFVPVSDLPTQVKVNVTGMGWDLLRRSAGVKVPTVAIPLERPSEVKKIVGSTLPVLFSPQVTDVQINFVATDTLRVDIEPLNGKWLTLTMADLSHSFKKGYGIASNATLTPDSVFVQGPRRIVEELQNPYPVHFDAKNIDENIDLTIAIPFAYDRLAVEPANVNLSFMVEKLVTVQDSVKLELINLPSGRRPAINVREVRYEVSFPESFVHSSYSREAIKATLDLKNSKTRKSKLAPTLSGLPPFAKLLRIDSIAVSY